MPKDDALIAELTAPTYAFTSTGKMVVESKADMKKRGMRSPDLADAFLLTFACGERKMSAIEGRCGGALAGLREVAHSQHSADGPIPFDALSSTLALLNGHKPVFYGFRTVVRSGKLMGRWRRPKIGF